jgi:hypothetical protein
MTGPRKSVLVTVAAVLTLLLGLLFATGVVLEVLSLLQGPEATPFANERMREVLEREHRTTQITYLILTLPGPLLLGPGALALFFRWRFARSLATIAVLYAAFYPALLLLFELMRGGSASTRTAVAGAIWLILPAFILISIWRRRAASEFAREP